MLLYYRSVSGVFSLVDFSPCLLMCRYPILMFIYFPRCFVMSVLVRPGKVFRKPCLIYLRRIDDVGMKNAAWRYCDSADLVVWISMLFTTTSDFCVSRATYHIPVWLLLMHLNISCPFLNTDTSWFFSLMVHPYSHQTTDTISGAVFVLGKMWIFLACLIRPGIWSVVIFDDSIVLPLEVFL